MIKTSTKFEWHGPAIQGQIKGTMKRRLLQCALIIQDEMKRVLNVPGNVKNKASVAKHGAIRSKPGEPPRKQTGNLQRGIVWDYVEAEQKVRVGVTENARYSNPLEEGAPKINLLPRPHWKPVWEKLKDRIAKILTTPMGGGQ